MFGHSDAGESPVHEPAFDPDPNDYVSWDYARGFLDGYESFEQEELGDAVNRIVLELRDRGWPAEQVMMLAFTGPVKEKLPAHDTQRPCLSCLIISFQTSTSQPTGWIMLPSTAPVQLITCLAPSA